MSDDHMDTMQHPAPKSPVAAYLLWFFLGTFGAHRFYMGRTGSGMGMLGLCLGSFLLSFVVIGLIGYPILFCWWVVDAFLISKWLQDEMPPALAGSIDPPAAQEAA